nr:reverse transcriptase domain-containing protein [Tanacetum cinerariifolium]
MVANQIRPPCFPPHQNNQNNFNRGNNFNQNRGGNFNQSNFNQSSFNQGQLNRPQVNQAPVYQAPIPQTQRVSQTDFESYVKANDAILRNMQSQDQSTLPDNTVTNPKEELKAITYNLDQTVRYSANYNQMTTNKIDVVESACEEYSQEVLGFSNVTASGNPTPQNDPIVFATSPTLTLFEDSDFLLFEEADAFLGLE